MFLMSFSWKNLKYPIILCPPMDGITDNAYRELTAEMGGSSALYCEFVNVKGLVYQNPKTIFELNYTENQRPIIVQLFGSDPDDFYQAAKLAVRMGFDAIDINMGCPAHKVASKGGGCALMGNTENAKKIVEMTINGANEEAAKLGLGHEIEVSCKMRLGVNDKTAVFTHGIEIIEAGAKAIAIHGRTLKQMYAGEADWDPIKEFVGIKNGKYGKSIKVFGSGDAKNLWEALLRILTTGVDGVMIGRGSFGNPWVFERSKVEFMKKTICNIEKCFGKNSGEITLEEIKNYSGIEEIKNILVHKDRSFKQISETAIHHAELMYSDKGDNGVVQMRKHLAWYFHGFDGAKELRSKLVLVNSIEEIKQILYSYP